MVANLVNISDVEKADWDIITDSKPYYHPLEKCQFIKKGIDSLLKLRLQPSVHVDIYPVLRMTTTDLNDVPKQFTDIQWDIYTEIELGWTQPHHTMSYEEYHYPAENAYYSHVYNSEYAKTKPCFQDNRSTFRGGYVSYVKKKSEATATALKQKRSAGTRVDIDTVL